MGTSGDAKGMGTARYQPLPSELSARELEEQLLARWREEQLFERTLAARAGAPRWVFFEGPPTANGKPGIHHGCVCNLGSREWQNACTLDSVAAVRRSATVSLI